MSLNTLSDLVQQLRALLDAATPGPWISGERIMAEDGYADTYRVTEEQDNWNVACVTFEQADADLVVALRNAAPELLAAAEENMRLLCGALRKARTQ